MKASEAKNLATVEKSKIDTVIVDTYLEQTFPKIRERAIKGLLDLGLPDSFRQAMDTQQWNLYTKCMTELGYNVDYINNPYAEDCYWKVSWK